MHGDHRPQQLHARPSTRWAPRGMGRVARVWLPIALVALGAARASAQVGPQWTATGPMLQGRIEHQPVYLPSGKIFVAAGWASGSRLIHSAEIYDLTAGTWSAAAPLPLSTGMRGEHTIRLRTGETLVAGVEQSNGNYAFLYDETKDQWSETANKPMGHRAGNLGRGWATMTLLPSGKALFCGGYPVHSPNPGYADAELYDPQTRSWSATESMVQGRLLHRATLLSTGKVLVAGGTGHTSNSKIGPYSLSSVELYDPVSGTWAPGASLSTPRTGHIQVELPSGEILVAGGESVYKAGARRLAVATAEIYNPSADTWRPIDAMAHPRAMADAVLLSTGQVLVAGGYHVVSPRTLVTRAELFDPVTETWSDGGAMLTPRWLVRLLPLPGGEAIAIGGFGPGVKTVASCEIFSNRTCASTLTVSAGPTGASPWRRKTVDLALTAAVADGCSPSDLELTLQIAVDQPSGADDDEALEDVAIVHADGTVVESEDLPDRAFQTGVPFDPTADTLRLPRAHHGSPGRTYTFLLTAVDASGGTGSAETSFFVPAREDGHDEKHDDDHDGDDDGGHKARHDHDGGHKARHDHDHDDDCWDEHGR